MYVDFITLAMDQVINQAAKLRYMSGGAVTLPLVIHTQGGAGTSEAAQHSQSLEAWFVHAPGVLVAMPATPYDAKGMLKTAIRSDDPVLFIEHKMLYKTKGEVPDEDYTVPFGRAVVRREGADVTIVSYSRMALVAMEAAEALAGEGIQAEVIDLRTVKPLDMATVLESVRKTGRVVLVSEGCRNGNVVCEIAMRINEHAFDFLDAPMARVCSADVPVPMSPVLEAEMMPSVEKISAAAREVMA